MEIITMNVSEIIPYDNNPRFNDKAVEPVAESIREFGFKVPILINKDNVIIAGHTRLKAAEFLQMTEIPCIRLEDLSPDQEKAFRIADNKVSEIADWNKELLSLEMSELLNVGIDFSELGFSNEDIEVLTKGLENIDFSGFFEEAEQKEKKEEEKRIQCPHCGEWFDLI